MNRIDSADLKLYNKQVRQIAFRGALKSFGLSLALDIIGSKLIPITFATSFLFQALFSYIVDVRIIRQAGLEIYQVKYDLFADSIDAARSAVTNELIKAFVAQQKFKLFGNIIPILGAFYTAFVVYGSIRKIGKLSIEDVM